MGDSRFSAISDGVDLNHSLRRSYFRKLRQPSLTLLELLRFQLAYYGRIYNDQAVHFRDKVYELAKQEGKSIDLDSLVIDRNGSLPLEAIQSLIPELESDLPRPKGVGDFEYIEILEPTKNELYNSDLPLSLGWRSQQITRPSFGVYKHSGGALYCTPHSFMYTSHNRNHFYPAASSRYISKSALNLPANIVDYPIVLIHDYGDGTSLAHFTFDYITRILHTIHASFIDPTKCLYVMGGKAEDYHKAFREVISSKYKINPANFFYPQEPTTLKTTSSFFFFSDHAINRMHPAQMCHPVSVSLLRELAAEVLRRNGNNCGKYASKIFISREDAASRKITNERELWPLLESMEYSVVRLSEMSFADQISHMAQADTIIGPHGMGFTHIIFNTTQFQLAEIFHPSVGTDAYALMTRALGSNYSFILGDDQSDNKLGYSVSPSDLAAMVSRL